MTLSLSSVEGLDGDRSCDSVVGVCLSFPSFFPSVCAEVPRGRSQPPEDRRGRQMVRAPRGLLRIHLAAQTISCTTK